MRIVIVGQGAREHALAWKLSQSPSLSKLWVIAGNAGTEPFNVANIDTPHDLVHFCRENKVNLVVIGPEQALAEGLADHLRSHLAHHQDREKFAVFGPGQSGAKLESSKVWARDFARRQRVAIPDYRICHGLAELRQLAHAQGPACVLKFDGLAAGKGSFVCTDQDSLDASLRSIEQRFADDSLWLVEQKLSGRELSQMVLFDGQNYQLLPSAQDYKAVFDDDQGPNSGGMGALSPAPDVDEATQRAIIEQIIEPSIRGLQQERVDFRGLIYFGLMLTAQGPKLLEYNVRFGDPESQVVLPRLDEDLTRLLYDCATGQLQSRPLKTKDQHYVAVVASSAGYPGDYQSGEFISGIEQVDAATLVFHAATRLDQAGHLYSSGGRVLNIVCTGENIRQARDRAYNELEKIHFKGMHYRRDIGRSPITKNVISPDPPRTITAISI